MAGIEQGYPDGLAMDAPDHLADYCEECPVDAPLHRPNAITSNGEHITAYYACPSGHAWASAHADFDYLWRASA